MSTVEYAAPTDANIVSIILRDNLDMSYHGLQERAYPHYKQWS